MKNIVDDPQFTAWLLGELSAVETAEMERAVAADPALQLVAREQQQFHAALTMGLGGESMVLDARQRDKIMRSARQLPQGEIKISVLPQTGRFRGWGWASLATAAALVCGVWVAVRQPLKKEPYELADSQITREISLLPREASEFPSDGQASQAVAVGGSKAAAQRDSLANRKPNEYLVEMAKTISREPLPTEHELPALTPRGFVSAKAHPEAKLPVMAGTASWNWVKRSVLEQNQLPHQRMARVEELINAFTLDAGQSHGLQGLQLRCETAKVIAVEDRYRLAVTMRNPLATAADVSLQYQPQGVDRYRLLGFASHSSSQQTTMLAAGASTTLLLELESAQDLTQVGNLQIIVNGHKNEVILPVTTAASPSFQFLCCIADFGDWLHHPTSATVSLSQKIAALELSLSDPQRLSALAILKKAISLTAEK